MPKFNIYLLIGDNELPKLNKIESIKKEILPKETREFNSEVLFSSELNFKILQESLSRLPVKTDKRFLVIRSIEKLDKDCREKIIAYLKKPYPWLVLVLEGNLTDKEIGDIRPHAETLFFRKLRPPDVFSLGRAVENKNRALALDILSDLLLKGEKPQKIMGGLIWHWENSGKYLGPEKVKKGFEALLEADLSIKRSLLKPNIALELLVVKLMLLA